ncbi:MAG: multidrug effflux MFS transporter [Pseudomonadota bacterium]
MLIRRAITPPSLTTLVLLTGLSVLSLNMFLPSLSNIAEDLEADYATVSLAVAGYLAVTAVIQLVIGPLSDRTGRRPVLLGCLLIFVVASLLCAISSNIWMFLICRLFQGAMISGYVLSLAIVRDTRAEREAAGIIGYISMAMAIAPMLGPMLGGLLDTAFGWRSNFAFYALMGAVLLVLCWIDLGETRPETASPPTVDAKGPRARDLLFDRAFWAYSLCGTFSTGAFYIFLTGAPLVAQVQFGVSTVELGFFIGSITAGFVAGSFVAGRYAPRYAPKRLMMAGRIVACGGLGVGIGLALISPITALGFFAATICVGIGNGITMPSSNAAAMSIRPNLSASAAGMSGAMIVAGGAILTTATGAVLPQETPALILLMLMFAASAAGLLALFLAPKRVR